MKNVPSTAVIIVLIRIISGYTTDRCQNASCSAVPLEITFLRLCCDLSIIFRASTELNFGPQYSLNFVTHLNFL